MLTSIAEGAMNWNGGQRITLQAGQTATCTTLNPGQLYAIFMYNSTQNDTNGTVNIVWSNSQPPVSVTVPGTTANAGLASLAFVSGSDTQTVSVSLGTNAGIAQIDLWLGSVSMPIDTTGMAYNSPLPNDGSVNPFNKYGRYYAVPPSSWQALTIVSTITQFISVQFTESKAVVYVVNESSNGLLSGQVVKMGPTASSGVVSINAVQIQSITGNFQGNGQQWVWLNADSEQDSSQATISLQSLS
ncbi:MAG TPA: hypothetical protein VF604_01820 [Pyrinomonadaceae bacterium]|jgi:hypothetical protein